MNPHRSARSSFFGRLKGGRWIVGAALATGAYLLLHRLALTDGGPPAEVGQYLLPLACLVATAFAATRGGTRRGGALGSLSIDEIHARLRDAFRAQGYQPAEGGTTADSRSELVLRRGRETFLVWAKPWTERRVGADAVQQLCRAMTALGATGGFVVSTGRFGRDAVALAAAHNVRLIDGRALRDLLAPARRP